MSEYQGDALNAPLQPDANHTVVDSAATRICADQKVGGILPAFEDYLQLTDYFESNGQGDFSSQGLKDFEAVFPDTVDNQNQQRWFWTSSIPYLDGAPSGTATVFTAVNNLDYGVNNWPYPGHYKNGFRAYNDDIFSVRCIQRAPITEVPAVSTFTTSKGAIFTQVQGPGSFGTSWKDPSGTIWSAYQGDFGNPITPGQIIVIDSPATEACTKVGGVLPTSNNYKQLISYFELTDNTTLSARGRSDLNSVFPDMQTRWFWSSSAVSDTPNLAFGFFGIYLLEETRDSADHGSVRCVAP